MSLSLSLLTLSHFFNIISQFLHQLLHNVTYTTRTAPCTTPIHISLLLYTTLYSIPILLKATYTILLRLRVILIYLYYTLYTYRVMPLLYTLVSLSYTRAYKILLRLYSTLIYLLLYYMYSIPYTTHLYTPLLI